MEEALAREGVTYTVAGIADSDNAMIFGSVFIPLNKYAERVNGIASVYELEGRPFPLEFSEFLLTDNRRLAELTVLFDEHESKSRQDTYFGADYFTDTSELDSVRRVRDLLILLFPIAVTAAIALGMAAPGLIIVQSSKEAAILRVLGTTKLRTRNILAIEQICLCVFGLALAAVGLVLFNSDLFVRSANMLALCGGLYLLGCTSAAAVASVLVTKRKVLELLQVKE
jgi:hypothetical protein